MAVTINEEKCTGCYACVIACPNALFIVENGKARVDNSGCTSCGICRQSCLEGAIKVLPGKDLGGGGY